MVIALAVPMIYGLYENICTISPIFLIDCEIRRWGVEITRANIWSLIMYIQKSYATKLLALFRCDVGLTLKPDNYAYCSVIAVLGPRTWISE